MTLPLIGCYQGNGGTGVAALPAFVSWFGRKPDLVLDFSAFATAAVPGDETWWPGYWTGQAPNIMSSVPLATGDVPLASAAAGGLDAFWTAHLQAIKAAGFATPYLRPGWEFNGGWYPWGNLNSSSPTTQAAQIAVFVATYRRFATAARAILPTHRDVWCYAQGNGLQIAPDAAYPGDDVVDVCGADFYARGMTYGTAAPTAADCEAYWQQGNGFDAGEGWLPWFAQQHGKSWAICELGIGDMPVNGADAGPGDSVGATVAQWLVAKLATYPTGTAPGALELVTLWDYDASDDADKLSTGERPEIAAVFRSAWGTAPTAAQTAMAALEAGLKADEAAIVQLGGTATL